MSFTTEVLDHFVGPNLKRAQTAIDDYYVRKPFTGRYFDVFADHEHPNEITERDLLAVEMLSVQVPAEVAIWILGDGRPQISSLLRKVDADVDIWNGRDLLQEGGELWRLWDLLDTGSWPTEKKNNGLGRTIKSKLLAAKRPRLVPILDKVVCDALPKPRVYWEAFCSALSTEENRLLVSVPTAQAPTGVSLLRRLDIVLWMAHKDDKPSPKRPRTQN